MINQNLSFQILREGVFSYLDKQLDQLKLDEKGMHHFVDCQKVYLNTIKSLANTLRDEKVSKSEHFLQKRQEFQVKMQHLANAVADIFYSLPQYKCYFSIEFVHGFYNQGTFPHVPKNIQKMCEKTKDIEMTIYTKLLEYNQLGDYLLRVNGSNVIIENEYFVQELEYFEGIFYVGAFRRQDKLELLIDQIHPKFMLSCLNNLGEQIKTIQSHPEFLNFVYDYMQNCVKQCQWLVIQQKYQEFSLVHPNTFEQFVNGEKLYLKFEQKQSNFNEDIVISGNTTFLVLKQSNQCTSKLINWNMEDNLENQLIIVLNTEKQKLEIKQKLKDYQISSDIYYKFETNLDECTIIDSDIEIIWNQLQCQTGFFIIQKYIITLGKMRLFYHPNFTEFKLCLRDQIMLDQIFTKQSEDDFLQRVHWIILRNALISIPTHFHTLKYKENENIQIRQNIDPNKCIIEFSPTQIMYGNNVSEISKLINNNNDLQLDQIIDQIKEYIMHARKQIIKQMSL